MFDSRKSRCLAAAALTAASLAASPGVAAALTARQGAQAAGSWLAGQFNAQGYIPNAGGAGADLPDMAQSVLALAAVGGHAATVAAAVTYLEGHSSADIVVNGSDDPGRLAYLILDAAATGADPHHFGGVDLVARLLATAQPSGLFGTANAEFDGASRQGLALAALASAGISGSSLQGEVTWLVQQQCPDGGWESLNYGCSSSDTVGGEDTNSTSYAVQGLQAQHVAPRTSPIIFLRSMQQTDGGWGYSGAPSDPDSTALVIQALVALGVSPAAAPFALAGGTPYTSLLSDQVPSGAFQFPGSNDPASVLLATEQAIPGALSLAFPLASQTVTGYTVATANGGVFAFGTPFLGSSGGLSLNQPIVATAATAGGYYLVAADGGVFSYGAARFFGSTGSLRLNKPIVGMAVDPVTGGYWLVASDGGVFAFNAPFFGSTGSLHLNKPIVGVAATPDGAGYYLVASDGGVFAFGDATFQGSTGGTVLAAPVTGIAADPLTGGYWLSASDGVRVRAPFLGSGGAPGFFGTGSHGADVRAITATRTGLGYYILNGNGGVYAFGDAASAGSLLTLGSPAGSPPSPAVGLAVPVPHL
jgi:Prenyltransferase and squalene oxidase repeat